MTKCKKKYKVKFFGIYFAICWHPIVKHIKQNKSSNMTNIKKVTNNKIHAINIY